MPWSSGKDFASKHNKKLKGAAATKAMKIANAIIRRGGDEGIAIATANKYGNKAQKKKKHSGGFGSLDGS